jgi:ATP-dependent DNA helicase HFM1/MER3
VAYREWDVFQLLNRRAPFGDAVVAAARQLPQYSLKVTEVSITTFGGDKPVTIELNIECGLVGAPEAKYTQGKKHKQASLGMTSLGMTAILTLTSDNNLVDFRRISQVTTFVARWEPRLCRYL